MRMGMLIPNHGTRSRFCSLVRVDVVSLVLILLFIQSHSSSFSSTDRKKVNIIEHWRNAFDPSIRRGHWTKSEVVTSLTLHRDLECKTKNAKITKRLKRHKSDVDRMMKKTIIPALLNSNHGQDSNNELVLSREDDEFNVSVNVAWAAVQKANGKMKKNQVAASTVVETSVASLSELVQKSNVANEIKMEKKRKLDEAKSKKGEKVAKIRRISEDFEKELADPKSENKRVLECRAAEKRLLDRGVPKELLDNLVAHYKSKLRVSV